MAQGNKIAVTLPDPVLEWIDAQVEEGRYYNRSHAVIALVREQQRRDARRKKSESNE